MEEQLTARAGKGGVVLIDRATGAMRFRTGAPMAHSTHVRPGDYVAVALSINPAGDQL